MTLTEGKMFGVLVVDTSEGLGFLAAYSGLLEGRNDWPYFVPPVYDAQQPDGYFKTREREISLTTHLSPLTTKKCRKNSKCGSSISISYSMHEERSGISSRYGKTTTVLPVSAIGFPCHQAAQATVVHPSCYNMPIANG